MAFNGTAIIPSMLLQRVRPNLLVVADHSVAGMRLADLPRSICSESDGHTKCIYFMYISYRGHRWVS